MHTTRSKSSFGPRPVGLLGTVLLALLLGGLSSSPVLAQDEPAGVLTGRVVDAASDAPLQDATVALWENTGGDSTLVRGTVTGPEGRFTIEDDDHGLYHLPIKFGL